MMRAPLSPKRIALARSVAMAADLVQIVLLPTFFPAAVSPVLNVVDVVAAGVLIGLLGWHWAFLPTFFVELVPIVDVVPTWTAAVYFVTRGRALPEDQPPPGPSGS